jgi:hypothetical protein
MSANAPCAANPQDCRKEAEMHKKNTLQYGRYSHDNGEDSTSNSIKNQHDLLQQYAERNNCEGGSVSGSDVAGTGSSCSAELCGGVLGAACGVVVIGSDSTSTF